MKTQEIDNQEEDEEKEKIIKESIEQISNKNTWKRGSREK